VNARGHDGHSAGKNTDAKPRIVVVDSEKTESKKKQHKSFHVKYLPIEIFRLFCSREAPVKLLHLLISWTFCLYPPHVVPI
jgi:hypothetical protein